jgi:hypothetical protein
MQPTESIASLTDRSPLSESTCAQLAYAFCRAAQDTDLSRAATDRYQVWAVAFVSWCRETGPSHVGPDRIGAFERVLRQRPGLKDEAVHEALDALAFLFGAVENVDSILPSDESTEGEADGEDPPRSGIGTPTDKPIQSLRIGWRDETDPEDAPSTSVNQGPQPTADFSTLDDTVDDGEEKAPMAETWIQKYQSQLASVHTSNKRTADASPPAPAAREPGVCSA